MKKAILTLLAAALLGAPGASAGIMIADYGVVQGDYGVVQGDGILLSD